MINGQKFPFMINGLGFVDDERKLLLKQVLTIDDQQKVFFLITVPNFAGEAEIIWIKEKRAENK